MSKKKTLPTYVLRARSYPNAAHVSVWLIRRDGKDPQTESWMLWGEVIPQVVEEIAHATGLPVEREASLWSNVQPTVVSRAGLTPVPEQASLFP